MTRMCTLTRTIVTALAVTIALALLLPAAASAQNPANCNANLFDVTISRDVLAAQPGETVNYTVNVINRSVSGIQVGCNTLDVSATFFCPGATGQSNGPSTPLFTNVDIPANDVLAEFGPLPCTMPNIAPGVAFAGVVAPGTLDDGNLSPFLIEKDVAVLVVSGNVVELTPIMTARFELRQHTPGVPDDRLVWVGQFTPATPIDPATEQVVVELSETTQCGGTFSSLTIPPGSFVPFQGGKVHRFTGPVTDGVTGEVVQTFIRIVQKTADTFTIALDLRDADFTCLEGNTNLTVLTTVDIGGDIAAGETCFGRLSSGDLYFPVVGAVCP
jgi:hypothetical protein